MDKLLTTLETTRKQLLSLKSLVHGKSPEGIIYPVTGNFVRFGCKITEGFSDADMILALDGQATGDEDHLNPDISSAPPTRPEHYPNIAYVFGRAFLKENVNDEEYEDSSLLLDDAPGSSGYGRHDIVYIFVDQSGPSIGIATGTASTDCYDAFHAGDLEDGEYPQAYDPTGLPEGVYVIARVYVEYGDTGIADERIADLRSFSGYLQGEKGDTGLDWKDAWGSGESYSVDDAVGHQGKAYICTSVHSNHEPPNETYWDLLASTGLTWQGAWNTDSATVYEPGDVVEHEGNLYICIDDPSSADEEPGTSAAATIWEMLTSKGDIGMTWQGAWNNDSATSYSVNDVVEHEGSCYICVQATSDEEPGTSSGAAYWEIVTQKGDTGITWEGAWAGSIAYAVNDMVEHGGSAYICIQTSTGDEPGTSAGAAFWDLLAQKGDTGGTGAKGDTGEKGDTGDVGLTWEGTWAGSITYSANDAVEHNGSAYICLQSSTGDEPGTSAAAAYWDLLSSKGDKGDTGDTGAKGDKGDTGDVGMTWEGAWNGSIAYSTNEAVEHGGSAYICLQTSTGDEPGTSAGAAYWDLLAQKGDTGEAGADIYKTVDGDTGSVVASGVADTLAIKGGTGITTAAASESAGDEVVVSADVGEAGDIVEINPDDAAAAGASGKLADAAHQHAFPCGTPGNITEGTAAAEGDAASGARSNHVHGFVLTRSVCFIIGESDDDVEVADGKNGFCVSSAYNGFNVVGATASLHTPGATSGTTDFQIRRRREDAEVDVLSTKVTIDTTAHTASDGVVNTDNDDLETGDILYADVDAITGTAGKGAVFTVDFEKPVP